jgi:probable phosphoglycerate mutase
MDVTRLIVVRHGETAWNVDARIQGQLDIGLNQKGRWQADQLGKALAHEDISAVVSSDLWRAYDTALSVAKAKGLQVTTDVGLRERGFGVYEGKTFAEIEQAWPEQALLWRKRVPDFAPKGGESLLQFRERILNAMHAVAANNVGQQILLATHGGGLDVLYRAATGQDLQASRSWNLNNATINRLLWSAPEVSGEWGQLSLVGWDDHSHLDNALSLDETST